MNSRCDTVVRKVSRSGNLNNYGTVLWGSVRIFNILSPEKVKNKFPVSYKSDKENSFIVKNLKK